MCVEVHGGMGGGGGGVVVVRDTPIKRRMITDVFFFFQDLGFSEFRVDSSKQNTEPSSYFMNLVFDF